MGLPAGELRDLGFDDHVKEVGTSIVEATVQGFQDGVRLLDRFASNAQAFGYLDEIESGEVEVGDGVDVSAHLVTETFEDVVTLVVRDDKEDIQKYKTP